MGLFSSQCPVDSREKTWIELRMAWLIERVGWDALLRTEVITPSAQHFREPYNNLDSDVERMFSAVCHWMQVPRESVELILFQPGRKSEFIVDHSGTPLGLYEQRTEPGERHKVWIEETQTTEPLHLVATMAHELAHCTLLGDEWLSAADADHEFVTDLLPVLRGMGIFLANSSIADFTYIVQNYRLTYSGKQGYLPARMFGYALALFVWLRDERDVSWSRHLRRDARLVFTQGLQYLQSTGNSRCQPLDGYDTNEDSDTATRLALLSAPHAGNRLEALWHLRRPGQTELTSEEQAALITGLDHSDCIVRCETAYAIAVLNHHDDQVSNKLLEAVRRYAGDTQMLVAIAIALGTQREPRVQLLEELNMLLRDESSPVAMAALVALRNFGSEAATASLLHMLRRFHKGLCDCDSFVVAYVVETLRAICESPQHVVAEYFASDNELRVRAHSALAMEIDPRALASLKLPTETSLPPPIVGWHPLLLLEQQN